MIQKEAAVKELDCKSPLGFVVMKLGSNFMVARRAINDSCRYFLDLPNNIEDKLLREKEELKENIASADIALERLQDNYVRLLNALEGNHSERLSREDAG